MAIETVSMFEPDGLGSATGGIVTTASPILGGSVDALLDAHEAAIRDAGFALGDAMRNRLLAPSRELRDALSAGRFRRFAGAARCATSSYIDAERFAGGEGGQLQTLVLRGAGAVKVVEEYVPPEPPCRFVAAGEVVCFSGMTWVAEDLETQVARIAAKFAGSRAAAEGRLGGLVRPVRATAYLHRDARPYEWPDLAAVAGVPAHALTIAWCDGYSKPGKLIELEVDAILDR